jgi:dTDP-4-dehydrorhamnose reductase
MKILILGANGMLGSTLFKQFIVKSELETWGTIRNSSLKKYFSSAEQSKLFTNIDVLNGDDFAVLVKKLRPEVIINCAGLIKQSPESDNPLIVLPINAMFPHRLAHLCSLDGARWVNFSTDGVFSGSKGQYTEDDIPDARDLYGLSKLMGEVIIPDAIMLWWRD